MMGYYLNNGVVSFIKRILLKQLSEVLDKKSRPQRGRKDERRKRVELTFV